jgi:son of sevenless
MMLQPYTFQSLSRNNTYDGAKPNFPWVPVSTYGMGTDHPPEVESPVDIPDRRGISSPNNQMNQSRTTSLHLNKPTPPTPISPPAQVELFRNRSETATTIISSLYPRKPIFTTPGAGPIPGRADPVPPPRLAPVNESSSGVSTETDTTDDVVLVTRMPRPEKVRQLTGDDNAQKYVSEANRSQAEKVWYLRSQYGEDELTLEYDGSVKTGTLRALVEQLTGDFTSAWYILRYQ